MMNRIAWTLGLCGLVTGSLWAQPGEPALPASLDAPPAVQAKPVWRSPVPVTRADLARAYIEIEKALAEATLTPAERTQVESEFDRLTTLFFSGNFGVATQRVHGLTRALRKDEVTPARVLAQSLKVIIEPAVRAAGEDRPVTARVVSMYPVDAPAIEGGYELSVEARTARSDPSQPLRGSVRITPDASVPVDVTVELSAPKDWPKDVAWAEVRVNGEPGGSTPLAAMTPPVEELREALLKRLDAVAGASPERGSLVAAVRARAELLSASPSDSNSAQFLTDVLTLGPEVEREVAAIEKGENPFKDRRGDYWTVAALDQMSVLPMRVYAPPATVLPAGRAAAVVIVLHGAGGDESMFMEGYGAGLIKRLADRHGFIVVSPRSEMVGTSKGAFDAMLATVKRDYTIDAERVYAVGHSMGAGVASGLAVSRRGELAGVACLAGGPRRPPGANMTPMLVIGAELDPLIPAEALRVAAENAVKGGAPVEFRLAQGHGHTLVVGAVLEQAVDWLLARTRAGKINDAGK